MDVTDGRGFELWPEVRRIAILRGAGLGDLILVLPAVEALAAAYPEAEITLLGAPVHAELFGGASGLVASPFSRVITLPPHQGVREGKPDQAASARFWCDVGDEEFDLAVQLHGGGRHSNPFLLRLGATHTVGSATEDATPLERTVPYVHLQHATFRALDVVALAGAEPGSTEPRVQLSSRQQEPRDRPLVLVHPGASDARRRWPAEHFAAVAAGLAANGAEVQVVGDPTETDLAAEVSARAGGPVISTAGRWSVPELAEQCARATLMVANDSGPRHLAAALGTATVGIFWVGNVINAAPLNRGRHRIQIGWATRCPVCDVDVTQVGWTAERCPHDDSLVADVSVPAVLADARFLLAAFAGRSSG